jgi:hypothetical protein
VNEQEQKAGEARVREHLIETLERMGLTRPGSMKAAAFEAMQHEICKRLAYMTIDGLGALAEDMAGRGGGKERDRFPLAVRILERALIIEKPPGDDAGPLVRKVFASRIGQSSIESGWAPELMGWVTTEWKWPGDYVVSKISEGARAAVREHERLLSADRAGVDLTSADRALLERRRAAIARCENARALGRGERATPGVQA